MTTSLTDAVDSRAADIEGHLDDDLTTGGLIILPEPGQAFDPEPFNEFVEVIRRDLLSIGTMGMPFVRTVLGRVRRYASTRRPTLWVDMGMDGWPTLYVNPEFYMSFDSEQGRQFALIHEVGHLQMRHLAAKQPLIARYRQAVDAHEATPSTVTADEVAAAERAIKLHVDACEYVVNDRYMVRVGASKLPTAKGGKVKFQDPKPAFRKFKKAAKDAGVVGFPDDYDSFVASVGACTGYLELLPEDTQPPAGRDGCRFTVTDECPECGRTIGSPPQADDSSDTDDSSDNGGSDGTDTDDSSDNGGSGGSGPCQTCTNLTDEGAHGDGRITNAAGFEEAMDRIYGDIVDRARAGNEDAKRDLFEIMDIDPDNPMWGAMGALQLRDVPVTTKVDEEYWKRRANSVFASQTYRTVRPAYNRQRAGIATPAAKRQLGIPYDPRIGEPFGRRGWARKPIGAVIGDLSGSMPAAFWDEMIPLIGTVEDKLTILWAGHDTKVAFGMPHLQVTSGGGTNFTCIDKVVAGDYSPDYVDGDIPEDWRRARRRKLDFVIVVTDGYAPEIKPADPGRWTWMITPTGSVDNPQWNDWPARHNMRVIRLPPTFMSTRRV